MIFTYVYLEWAANHNMRVGAWKEQPIYAIKKADYLTKKYLDNYYIIYDDGNLLVKNGLAIGSVSKEGQVLLQKEMKDYFQWNEYKEKKREEIEETARKKWEPQEEKKSSVFDKMEQDIDEILNSVVEWKVN